MSEIYSPTVETPKGEITTIKTPEANNNQAIKEEKPVENPDVPSEYLDSINNLTPDEVTQIYHLLLNIGDYESNTNKLVKHFTGQEELEDYQQLLLAPANGLENIGNFFSSLLTEKGYTDIANGINNIQNTPKILTALWQVFYEKLTPLQKLAVGVQLSTNVITSSALSVKFIELLKVITPIKILAPTLQSAKSFVPIVNSAENMQNVGAVPIKPNTMIKDSGQAGMTKKQLT